MDSAPEFDSPSINESPLVTEMHNVQTDHKTVMTVEKVMYDVDIPKKIFTKTNLEQGS